MSTPVTVEALRDFLASVCEQGCGERLILVENENRSIVSTVATVCWLHDGVHLGLDHANRVREELR